MEISLGSSNEANSAVRSRVVSTSWQVCSWLCLDPAFSRRCNTILRSNWTRVKGKGDRRDRRWRPPLNPGPRSKPKRRDAPPANPGPEVNHTRKQQEGKMGKSPLHPIQGQRGTVRREKGRGKVHRRPIQGQWEHTERSESRVRSALPCVRTPWLSSWPNLQDAIALGSYWGELLMLRWWSKINWARDKAPSVRSLVQRSATGCWAASPMCLRELSDRETED